MFLDASGDLPIPRCELGRIVREAWVRWAHMQPNPKPSWLAPYDELCEADRDADDLIGEAVARAVMLAIAARNGSPAHDVLPDLIAAARCAREAVAPMSSAAAHKAYQMLTDALAKTEPPA